MKERGKYNILEEAGEIAEASFKMAQGCPRDKVEHKVLFTFPLLSTLFPIITEDIKRRRSTENTGNSSSVLGAASIMEKLEHYSTKSFQRITEIPISHIENAYLTKMLYERKFVGNNVQNFSNLLEIESISHVINSHFLLALYKENLRQSDRVQKKPKPKIKTYFSSFLTSHIPW